MQIFMSFFIKHLCFCIISGLEYLVKTEIENKHQQNYIKISPSYFPMHLIFFATDKYPE